MEIRSLFFFMCIVNILLKKIKRNTLKTPQISMGKNTRLDIYTEMDLIMC